MADQEVDLEHRDPLNINSHIRALFEDVIAEPEGTHAADCVWRNAYKCFTGGKNCCYMILSGIFGLPSALCWGWMYAILSCEMIWCATPAIKSYFIFLNTFRLLYTSIVRTFCDPCFESCGRCLGDMKITEAKG